MRRYRALQILVVFIFACMCAASWSEAADLKSRILGKWVEEGGTERIEFLQDGTVIIVQGTMSAAGDYRFIDSNRLRIDLKGLYGSKVFEVVKSAKTGALVMKEPNGKVSIYVTEAEAARRVAAAKKAAAEAERKRKEAEQKRLEAAERAQKESNKRLLELKKVIISGDSLEEKIDRINNLLAMGLDLNAPGERYVSPAIRLAVDAEDARLMDFLISKGIKINNVDWCIASGASQHVISPAGREMVELMFERGLDIGCTLTDLVPFVFGVSNDIDRHDWKAEEAIKALEMMRKWRINLEATQYDGKTLLEYLDGSSEEIRTKAAPVIEYLQAGSNSARQAIADSVLEAAALEKKTIEERLREFSGVIAVAAGGSYSVALKKDGTVWIWGYLNGVETKMSLAAVKVEGLSDVIAITANGSHNIAIRKDGTVWAWGANRFGQLGDGTTTDSANPVQVKGLSDVVAVSTGGSHTIALKRDGTVWFWGATRFDQHGYVTTIDSVPMKMKGLSDIVTVAAGALHAVALKKDGTVWISGLPDDSRARNIGIPVKVKGLSGVMAISAGLRHAIAIKKDGTVWAWGDSEVGDGDGKALYSLIPLQMKNMSNFISFANALEYRVALKKDGTVWTWGAYDENRFKKNYSTVTTVKGISDVVAVATGGSHTVVLKKDGTVWAWGFNDWGQLGNGTTTNSSIPVQVKRLADDATAP